jgi:putative glutamine amidotransferase
LKTAVYSASSIYELTGGIQMAKPVIGLIPLYDFEQERLWMRPNYLRAVTESGGIPLVLPLMGEQSEICTVAGLCDGFLLTGGPDVHPALYNEDVMRYCGAIDEKRDTLEILLLYEAIQRGKPVLGICRGIQLINVALGGTLYQDIPAQVKGDPIAHYQKPPYHVPVHSVTVERDSPLYQIVNQEKLMVDSMHHQAIKELAPSLRCAARSKDGLAECVYLPETQFLMGVQWHPEWMFQPQNDSFKIFSAFVDAAK